MTGTELNQKPECDTWPSRWAQRIEHSRPDTVLLMLGRWEIVDRMRDGSGPMSATPITTTICAVN